MKQGVEFPISKLLGKLREQLVSNFVARTKANHWNPLDLRLPLQKNEDILGIGQLKAYFVLFFSCFLFCSIMKFFLGGEMVMG